MIEQLIEKMKLEGKITTEEINQKVAELKAQQPPSLEEEQAKQMDAQQLRIKQLEAQQNQTNEDLAGLMDFIISGGM